MLFSTQLVAVLLLYILVFGFFGFLFCCADPDAPGMKGEIARFFSKRLPRYVRQTVIAVCGRNVWGKVYGVYEYAVHRRNPIMQGMYLLVLNGAFISWLIWGAPQLPMLYIGNADYYIAHIWVALCHLTFYWACTVSAGTITNENAACFNHQPYDGLLYTSGHFCKTCRVPKVSWMLLDA